MRKCFIFYKIMTKRNWKALILLDIKKCKNQNKELSIPGGSGFLIAAERSSELNEEIFCNSV